jgi:hypothetical protein
VTSKYSKSTNFGTSSLQKRALYVSSTNLKKVTGFQNVKHGATKRHKDANAALAVVGK